MIRKAVTIAALSLLNFGLAVCTFNATTVNGTTVSPALFGSTTTTSRLLNGTTTTTISSTPFASATSTSRLLNGTTTTTISSTSFSSATTTSRLLNGTTMTTVSPAPFSSTMMTTSLLFNRTTTTNQWLLNTTTTTSTSLTTTTSHPISTMATSKTNLTATFSTVAAPIQTSQPGDVDDICKWYPNQRFSKFAAAVQPANHVIVYLQVFIVYLDNIDIVGQTVKMTLTLRATWDDLRFRDPQRLLCPTITIENLNKIWRPVVTVLNAAQDTNYVSLKESGAALFPTGHVLWPRTMTTTIACEFNVLFFPWDTQDCEILLGIPHYPKSAQTNDYSVHLISSNASVFDALTPFNVMYDKKSDDMAMWQLTKGCYYYRDTDPVPSIHYRFRLEHKPKYYLLVLGMPTVLTSALMAGSFIVDSGNGEKVTYALTVLLSYFLLLFAVVAEVPANSQKVPTVFTFLIVLMLTSCLATFVCTLLRKCAKSKNEQQRKMAKALNIASLVGYVVITSLEYASFAAYVVSNLRSEADVQEFNGGCNYTKGVNITKSVSYYNGWMANHKPPPPEFIAAMNNA